MDNSLQDDSSDFDKEEIECAIALSLSEEDQKGKKVVGKLQGCKHRLGSYSQFWFENFYWLCFMTVDSIFQAILDKISERGTEIAVL